MSDSKKIKCAYSGKPGAYAQQAADKFFKKSCESVPMNSFAEVFEAVTKGNVEYGMIPIENSLNGSVYQNYDNFNRFENVIISGAVTLKIHHSLLACKGAKLEDIKTVYSHPQAFGQSRKFLEEQKGWTLIDAISTATAAAIVADRGEKSNAAIGSTVNAEIYNLDILAENIQDEDDDFTRFVVIAAKDSENVKVTEPDMLSLVFTTKNEPGALYRALGVFEDNSLNMTRIASRPIAGQLWKSWFYVDIEMKHSCKDVNTFVSSLLKQLKDKTETTRLLGVYSEGSD